MLIFINQREATADKQNKSPTQAHFNVGTHTAFMQTLVISMRHDLDKTHECNDVINVFLSRLADRSM